MHHHLAVLSILICFPAIAQNSKPPLVNLFGDLLSNNASVSMTAYAITGFYGPILPRPDGIIAEWKATTYSDSVVDSGRYSMAPGQSWHVVIVKNPPSRMEFLAAVFEDGSAYGDPEGVRQILDRRKNALAAYQDSVAKLEADLKGGKSNQQIQEEFKTARTEATTRLQSRDSGYLDDIYNLVINGMTGDGSPKRILDILWQRRIVKITS